MTEVLNLTFAAFRDANLRRLEESFHALDGMDGLQWGACAAGEMGEALEAMLLAVTPLLLALNQQKKMWRAEHAGELREAESLLLKVEDARKIAKEVAGAFVYADLWLARIGVTMEDALRREFNDKSDEIGSSIKI